MHINANIIGNHVSVGKGVTNEALKDFEMFSKKVELISIRLELDIDGFSNKFEQLKFYFDKILLIKNKDQNLIDTLKHVFVTLDKMINSVSELTVPILMIKKDVLKLSEELKPFKLSNIRLINALDIVTDEFLTVKKIGESILEANNDL